MAVAVKPFPDDAVRWLARSVVNYLGLKARRSPIRNADAWWDWRGTCVILRANPWMPTPGTWVTSGGVAPSDGC